ncbi:hypothetical protein F4678DRAFT_15519 [Xylaria arbuscula]|nr:hypothetical protein F4678DRAFT_15519 [Xylaria arbuscula]
MSARSLVSSAPRAMKSEMQPLIHTHPNSYTSSLPMRFPGKFNACIIRHYSIESRSSLITASRLLSSSSISPFNKRRVSNSAGKDKPPRQPPSNNNHNSTPSEEDFKVSFRDLGMNRITKFVVYFTISVLGTMESIFWCQTLWRWWAGVEEDNE